MKSNLFENFLTNSNIKKKVDSEWNLINEEFELVNLEIEKLYSKKGLLKIFSKQKIMRRRELSFHDHIKLLGYLALECKDLEGDILEIGVWKGKSLALMDRMSPKSTKIFGIDPCVMTGQEFELREFLNRLVPEAKIIVDFSENAFMSIKDLINKIKILHIDGSHFEKNVWSDFLLYSKFVTSRGYIVFDDYNDHFHSPEVKLAVDGMISKNLFNDFEILGVPEQFRNSFVIQKK